MKIDGKTKRASSKSAAAGDLFGAPEKSEALSQWFTPSWIARRAMLWIPADVQSVLEPSAGDGALIEGLIRRGVPQSAITACELDPRFAAILRERYPGIELHEGDFLERAALWRAEGRRFDAIATNPPYEDDLDTRFLMACADLVPDALAPIVFVGKADTQYGIGRAASLWRCLHTVRRGMLIERPSFGRVEGKEQGAERNYDVYEFGRGARHRIARVIEEAWSRTDQESDWSGPIRTLAA